MNRFMWCTNLNWALNQQMNWGTCRSSTWFVQTWINKELLGFSHHALCVLFWQGHIHVFVSELSQNHCLIWMFFKACLERMTSLLNSISMFTLIAPSAHQFESPVRHTHAPTLTHPHNAALLLCSRSLVLLEFPLLSKFNKSSFKTRLC